MMDKNNKIVEDLVDEASKSNESWSMKPEKLLRKYLLKAVDASREETLRDVSAKIKDKK